MASTVSVVHAKGQWNVTFGFFRNNAQFFCGDCGKLNQKESVIPMPWHNHPGSIIAVAQCRWCGVCNSFWNGTRVLTLH